MPESDNFIFGRCVNPYDPSRTCGGSSGGEGSLIASRCSPLGLGTDIGGSIRIPAFFCGIYGFKPTPERLTQRGLEAPRPIGLDGQNAVFPTAGPMGRCTDDLAEVMKVWLNKDNGLWNTDPTVPVMPFNEDIYNGNSKLRIGYYLSDRFWEPSSVCKRAVMESVEALRAAGHEVVEWDPNAKGVDTYQASLLYYGLMASDGNLREFKRGLEGEALHPLYSLLDFLASIPRRVVRPSMSGILRMCGMTRFADLTAIAHERATHEFWQLQERRIEMKNRLIDAMREDRIDLLLTPGLGLPAFEHGGSRELTPICSYTFIWNLFHFPAGSVPVTTVRGPGFAASMQTGSSTGSAGGARAADAADECIYDCPASQADPLSAVAKTTIRTAGGLPVGVQLVGLPLQEEKVLRGMRELEKALQASAAAPSGDRQTATATNPGGVSAQPAALGYCPEAVLARSLAHLKQRK